MVGMSWRHHGSSYGRVGITVGVDDIGVRWMPMCCTVTGPEPASGGDSSHSQRVTAQTEPIRTYVEHHHTLLNYFSSADNELAQRKGRKERNEMTSSLDRPITVASDDGVCRWHAAKLWQTRAKLLKLNLICIISCTTSKNRTKIWSIDVVKKFLNLKSFSSAGKRTARLVLMSARK